MFIWLSRAKSTNLLFTYLPSAKTKLRKGNVFTSMCQEFCPHHHPPLPGQTRQTPPTDWANTPQVDNPPGQKPQQMATVVDGMHPTRMHSC